MAKPGVARATRPSRTTHSSSAIDVTASITSSDGSLCSRLLSVARASVRPICPSAQAADLATDRSRSSRRSTNTAIRSGKGRVQRQASARMLGSACRSSQRKTSTESVERSRVAARNAIPSPGPRTTARSINSATASAASRPPIMASACSAAACSGIVRSIPKPAKRRHNAASAGMAAESCRRPASEASAALSTKLDSGWRPSTPRRPSRLPQECVPRSVTRACPPPARRHPRKDRAAAQAP